MKGILSIVLTLVLVFGSWGSVKAQWSTDPTENTRICIAPGDQYVPQVVPDGEGGAIITWYDYRSGSNYDIYVQRVKHDGVAQWATNGVDICRELGDQYSPQIVSDGEGGAIITWNDYRSGSHSDIYAQRVKHDGGAQWTIDGVAICTALGGQYSPQIVSDGEGGAIITWYDYRSGSNFDIYVQRVNHDGVTQWTTDGVAICRELGDQYVPQIVPDGEGGAIITWYDYRSGSNFDIYVQRVNHDGVTQWTTDGVAICTALGDQSSPQIVPDGEGGAIITWNDYRSGSHSDIYARRVNQDGGAQWTTDGVAICTALSNQYSPQIVSDGEGGAIITWYDYRSGSNYDIYARRVNHDGVAQWATDGVAICRELGDQYVPQIVPDGEGGAIITWYDYRSGSNFDIYARRVNHDGVTQWTTDGVAICTALGDQSSPQIVPDGEGSAIITWYDYRSGNNHDIYAQKINRNGSLEVFAPKISFDPDSFPQFPDTLDFYQITCKVTDNVSVASCSLFYSINVGTTFACTTMVSSPPDDSIWTGNIPAQQTNIEVNYYIFATDSAINVATLPPDAPDSTFSFLVVDATRPAISHTPVDSASADSAVMVTGIITDNLSIQEVWLFYKRGGVAAYDSMPMDTLFPPDDTTYVGEIPAASVTERGVQYYISAVDSALNRGSTGVYSVFVKVSNLTIDEPLPATSYRMISLPIQPSDGSPQAILVDDLGAYDDTKWRLGRWSPADNGYHEYTVNWNATQDNFRTGRGYWLIVKDSKSIDASGTSVDVTGNYTIVLQPGWNQIGSPFVFDIRWDEVIKGENVQDYLYRYDDGGYEPAIFMEPWYGYWVRNLGSVPDTIWVPPTEFGSKLPKTGLTSGEDKHWEIKLSVRCGSFRDDHNYLGVSPDASDEWDRLDFFEPPPAWSYVSLYFPHKDQRLNPGDYTTDFRPEFDDGQIWEFVIKTNVSLSDIELNIDQIESVPIKFEVYLFDIEGRRVMNLRDDNRYRFNPRGSDREFRIVIGTPEYIQKVRGEFSSIPAHFSLSQNYPNPFNPITKIKYALPQDSYVRLEIFNILGEKVATLVNGRQKAGYKSVSWDGGRFSSGIYFYRLNCGDYTQTRRMILLK